MVRKNDSSYPPTVSRAERRRRLFGSRRLEMERLESRQLLALLSSGTGEGHLQVQVNEFGAFGRSGDLAVASPLQGNNVREITDAFYDPIGPLPSAGTTFESGLAVRVNGDPVTFLTAGTIADSGNFTNGLFNVPVDPSNRVLQSTFYYPPTAGPQGQGASLRFDLRQELIIKLVSGTAPVGVTLRQTYTVTNLTGNSVDLEIFRYYDGDLLYDSSFTNDGAGMRQVFQNEPERVWMANTATNTNRNNPAYVEVRSNVLPDSSGVPTTRVNRWEVGLAMGQINTAAPYTAANPGKNQPAFATNAALVQKILNGGPLANDIVSPTQSDIDGNNKVDPNGANDWAVTLRNVYSLAGPNASIVYVADTQFGDPEIGDAEPVVPPPVQRGTVTGVKFSDTNSNGVFDIGEFGVGGFRIYADVNNNSRFDNGEPNAITDSNGQYSFLLNTGTWNIREVQQANWTQTFPALGYHTVTLVSSGDLASNINFGNRAEPGSVSGMVFEDLNKNGRFELGEPGLGSVVVYADINNNGAFDVGEPNAVSAPGTGSYTIANMDPRSYVIRQVVPAGYDQTTPANNQPHIVAVSPAQNVGGISFGNALRDGVVNGKVYSDVNNNGLIDPGEPGVSGAIVWLDRDNDCKIGLGENAIVTGADGTFGMYGIRPGTYNARISPPVGFDSTFPAGTGCGAFITITVAPGQGTADVNFLLSQVASLGPDFGDAPYPYPTTLAQNGARHTVQRDFGLGALQDGEADGQPSPLANADDYTGIDDEDGVQFDTIYYAPGSTRTIFVSVETGGRYPGKLQGFIDFNRDGDWNDPGERIILDYQIGTTNLPVPISFQVPANAVPGETFARFRYGYEPGLGPTGPSIAGEVEDYRIFIAGPTPTAVADSFNLVDAGLAFTLDVLSNDIPSFHGALTITNVTQPSTPGAPAGANGVVTISADGLTLSYNPSGLLGAETFTYTITDPAGNESTATVTIDLSIPPRAEDDAYLEVPQGTNSVPYILGPANSVAGVLDNDIAGVGSLTIVGIQNLTNPGGGGGVLEFVPGSTTLLRYRAGSSAFAGVEQFQYTVVNGDGLTDTAVVTIQVTPGASNALVSLQVEVLDLSGNPLTGPIGVGQQFLVRVSTQDLRPDPVTNPSNQDVRGVYAAYLDLMFNQTLVHPVADINNAFGFAITFGPNQANPNYGGAQTADLNTPGVINEVGGYRDVDDPLGPNEVEVFTVRFVVASTATDGIATFLTDPADDSPASDVLLFEPPQPVAPNQLLLSQDSVQIVLGTPVDNSLLGAQPEGSGGPSQTNGNTAAYRNSYNSYDVDNSGGVSPIDALLIVNALNFRGPYSLVEDANPATLHAPIYLDVNGDGVLSPLDALLVITHLNSAGSSEPPPVASLAAPVEESATTETSGLAPLTSLTIEPGETLTLSPIEVPASGNKVSLLSEETENAVASALLTANIQPVAPAAVVLGSDTESDYGVDRLSSSEDDDLIESILTDLTL